MFRMRTLAVLAATVAAVCLSVPICAQAGSFTLPAVQQAQASLKTALPLQYHAGDGIHIGPAAQHVRSVVKSVSHLQFSGVALGRENFFDRDQSAKARLRIDGAGFQAVRDVFIWNGTDTPSDVDLTAACNAAQVSGGLKVLMFNLRPGPKSWPADQASLDAYNKTLDAFLNKIFKGTGTDGLPCLPAVSPPQIMLMIGNEPNSHTFCVGSGTSKDPLETMHQACAIREAILLHSSYAFIQSEELTYGRSILVVGGGLSSHDAPFDFLTRYLQAIKNLGYKTCDMDYFGYHPYALNATDPYSGFPAVESKLVPMLKAAGCPLKIIYTEMGVETVIPNGYSYTGTAPAGVYCASEADMPAVYTQIVKIIQAQPDVIGFMNFELDDEVNLGGWQSGFYYYSFYPKPFVPILRSLMAGIGGGPTAPLILPTR